MPESFRKLWRPARGLRRARLLHYRYRHTCLSSVDDRGTAAGNTALCQAAQFPLPESWRKLWRPARAVVRLLHYRRPEGPRIPHLPSPLPPLWQASERGAARERSAVNRVSCLKGSLLLYKWPLIIQPTNTYPPKTSPSTAPLAQTSWTTHATVMQAMSNAARSPLSSTS